VVKYGVLIYEENKKGCCKATKKWYATSPFKLNSLDIKELYHVIYQLHVLGYEIVKILKQDDVHYL